MPRKARYSPTRRPIVKRHISVASITRQTVRKYTSAMNSFFKWRKAKGLCAQPDLIELDLQLGNYLNYLYQNDLPLYLGTNCIAGFKKFHPRCKRQLETASTWLNNWSRVAAKVQAMPLHPVLVKAFVAYGILRKEPDFALSIYVGFLALLRGCEIFNFRMCDVQPRGPRQVNLILRGTKGAKRRGVEFETVTVKDPVVVKNLLKRKAQGTARLFAGREAHFAALYKDAVNFFRLRHPKPTPHGIRRGGASWHFGVHGSYDRTVEHGRWATITSARVYINEAAAEEAAQSPCAVGQERINDAVSLCPTLLRRTFGV